MEKLTATGGQRLGSLCPPALPCLTAFQHLPVVPILHLHSEVPPAQKSAFYAICKAQNTRGLMPSRFYVNPAKTRGREKSCVAYFPDKEVRFKIG